MAAITPSTPVTVHRCVPRSERCPNDRLGDARRGRRRLRGRGHQRRRGVGHPGQLPGAARRRPAAGPGDHQQLARPGRRQPEQLDRLPPRAARPAAAAPAAPPRLDPGGAHRRLPAAAPAGVDVRGGRAGAHRHRRPARRPPTGAATEPAGPGRRRRTGARRTAGGALRRRLRHGHLRGVLRRQPGRPADRHLRLDPARVAAAAERDQERPHLHRQRRRGGGLRRGGHRPGRLGGRRTARRRLAGGGFGRLAVRPPPAVVAPADGDRRPRGRGHRGAGKPVSVWEFGLLVLAGMGSGLIGSIAGLASLISYPALLAAGLPPVTANVTNTAALVLTGVGSVSASRPELKGQGRRLVPLAVAAVLGGAAGAALLLSTPTEAFERIVPWLIGGASLAILVQRPLPELAREGALAHAGHPHRDPRWLPLAVFAIAIYGGYFGAAAGVVILATYPPTT